MKDYAEAVINTPSFKTFHYLVPENLKGNLSLYQRVVVPLQKRKEIAYIVSFPESSLISGLKYIESVYDPFPVITEELFKLAKWMSDEYCCSLGLCLHAILPQKTKFFPPKRKKFVNIEELLELKYLKEGDYSVFSAEAPYEKKDESLS